MIPNSSALGWAGAAAPCRVVWWLHRLCSPEHDRGVQAGVKRGEVCGVGSPAPSPPSGLWKHTLGLGQLAKLCLSLSK